jgi:hypothetical protein
VRDTHNTSHHTCMHGKVHLRWFASRVYATPHGNNMGHTCRRRDDRHEVEFAGQVGAAAVRQIIRVV